MRKQGQRLPFHTFTTAGPAEIDPAIIAFSAIVGRVTLQWSTMQDALAELFAEIVSPQNHLVGIAIWNVLKSDSNQRDQLRAAAAEVFEVSSVAAQEIDWVINRANECAGDRNDVTHTPFTLRWNSGNPYVATSTVTRGKRAQRLADKELAAEATRCLDRLIALTVYAHRIREAIANDLPAADWPTRPDY